MASLSEAARRQNRATLLLVVAVALYAVMMFVGAVSQVEAYETSGPVSTTPAEFASESEWPWWYWAFGVAVPAGTALAALWMFVSANAHANRAGSAVSPDEA